MHSGGSSAREDVILFQRRDETLGQPAVDVVGESRIAGNTVFDQHEAQAIPLVEYEPVRRLYPLFSKTYRG